ncbi:MAG TPA: endonuclease [Syntrophomonas sp.]|jgi:hypothetical protein|nr:endonuclease [Syntrophomonas sp.]
MALKKSYYQIRNASDRICRENGLSLVRPVREKGKGFIKYTDAESGQRRTRPAKEHGRSYAEYAAYRAGGSWKSKLRTAVDAIIPQAADFEDFLQRLQPAGYEIKRSKYISCRAPGQERFTRLKTLGEDYTEEAITERIQGKRIRTAKAECKDINLIIDIQNSIKVQESRGYEQWAKIHNLKQTAKTLNFLTENNILQYGQLQVKIAEVNTATLKGVEKRLSDMALLIKNITTYQQTKPVYDRYRRARNKEHFKRMHESSLILHEASTNALKKIQSGNSKLPNVAALQVEYERLAKEEETLYGEYGKLKKQVKQYDVIKANVDKILDVTGRGREPEKDKRPSMDL